MPVRDALALQVMLTGDLRTGGLLERMLDSFEESQRGIAEPDPRSGLDTPMSNRIGRFAPVGKGGVPYRPGALSQYLRWTMAQSLAFYIDAMMTPLVTAAAETMPPEPLMASDMPTPHGFLLIPNGISEVDVRGQMLVHNVVTWSVTMGGVDIFLWSNKYDDRDSVNLYQRERFGADWMTALPMLTLAHYTRINFGEPLPRTVGARKMIPPEVSRELKVVKDDKSGSIAWMWPEGYDMEEWLGEANVPRQDPTSTWLIAAWRLMQQTLVKVSEEEVDRHVRRQARKIALRSDKVTVITLRRMAGTEGEGDAEVIWSHRFWRRGHWRMTWVGPLTGGPDVRYQRAVWISPTIVNKDREDLPFLDRDHVYNLSR